MYDIMYGDNYVFMYTNIYTWMCVYTCTYKCTIYTYTHNDLMWRANAHSHTYIYTNNVSCLDLCD